MYVRDNAPHVPYVINLLMLNTHMIQTSIRTVGNNILTSVTLQDTFYI